MVELKKVETDEEFQQTLKLRFKVFVDEQGVPEEIEHDDKDEKAVHFMAREENKTIGCGRIVFSDNKGKIGRVAVDKEWRKEGIGSKICTKLIEIARKRNIDKLVLHAQYDTVEFYKKLGFKTIGDTFQEAGIKHIKMIKILSAG